MSASHTCFEQPIHFPKLTFGESVMFLGSCFSEHMQSYLQKCGFLSHKTPYGPVFHPLALSYQLNAMKNKEWQPNVVQVNDVFLDYFSNSVHYAFSAEALTEKLQETTSQYHHLLQNTSVLFITFGTANGFRLKNKGEIVANCHKQPQQFFERVLSPITEMLEEWNKQLSELHLSYPSLKVVLTVSPVRYTKEGILENMRSKARLIETANELAETYDFVSYFPSFELVNDVLRDFSFFEEDLAHPNARAVAGVEEMLRSWLFSAETEKVVKEVLSIRQREQHRVLFKGSSAEQTFLTTTQQKKEQLSSLFPTIVW